MCAPAGSVLISSIVVPLAATGGGASGVDRCAHSTAPPTTSPTATASTTIVTSGVRGFGAGAATGCTGKLPVLRTRGTPSPVTRCGSGGRMPLADTRCWGADGRESPGSVAPDPKLVDHIAR